MFYGDYPPGVTGKMIDALENQCCCGNCTHYDGEHCMKEWNNLEDDYYIPERDDKESDDYCDDWECEEEYEKDPSDIAREDREYCWMAEANGWEVD